MNYVLILVGGGLGSVLRYSVTRAEWAACSARAFRGALFSLTSVDPSRWG